MRFAKYIFLLVALLIPASMALAAEPGEKVIKQQVIVPSFDIWQHSNGVWQDTDRCGQPDYYGWKGKTYSKTFALPETEWKGKYKLTRAEVTYPFTKEQFNSSGRQEDWGDFYDNYIKYTPGNYSVKSNENLAEGKVTAQWMFDLEPELLDLKDPVVRESLGMGDKDFSNMAQGWRWYLPVQIKWYGVPKENPKNCVASAIDPGVTGTANPNQKYNGTVAFKYFGDQPVQGVPIGVFNGKYQAVLKDAAGNAVTAADFDPGEKKTYNFAWTAPPEGSATLTGVINVSPLPDLFQETTKDDNKVSVTVNTLPPCTDISVTLTNPDDNEIFVGYTFELVATVKRANDGPAGPVRVKVHLSGKGIDSENPTYVTLNRGQSRKVSFFAILNSGGSHTYTVTATPVEPDGIVDCAPGNNKASYTVKAQVVEDVPKSDSKTRVEVVG